MPPSTYFRCSCCLRGVFKNFTSVDDKLQEIFHSLTNLHMESGNICLKCRQNLYTFNALQTELRIKHTATKHQKKKVAIKNCVHAEGKDDNSTNSSDTRDEITTESSEEASEEDQLNTKVIAVESVSQIEPSEVTKNLIGKKIVIDWKNTIMKPLNPANKAAIPPSKRAISPTPPAKESQMPKKRAKKMIVPMRSVKVAEKATQQADTSEKEADDDDDEVIELPAELPIDIDSLPDVADTKKESKGLNLLKCDFCNAVSNKRETLDEHIRLSHSAPCTHCHRAFPSTKLMMKHVIETHKTHSTGTKKRKQALEPKKIDDGGFRMSSRVYVRKESEKDELFNIITRASKEKLKKILKNSRAAQ